MSASGYRFVKVEDFFRDYRSWPYVTTMRSYQYDAASKAVSLDLGNSDGSSSSAKIHFLNANVVRIRFCPHKKPADFTSLNTRSVAMDKVEELQESLAEISPFTLEARQGADEVEIVARDDGTRGGLIVHIDNVPAIGEERFFRMSITDHPDPLRPGSSPHEIWRTDNRCFFFSPNVGSDFSIVHAVRKPATARFIGFGEQGGKSLIKNTEQVNFFNFDNMRYKQVYNQGPLDPREPLYHSDPFFLQFNGNPQSDCLQGIFIDNQAQVLVDIGYFNSGRYLLGTRFGDFDFYLIAGPNAADVLRHYTRLVGRSRLKPRYALGYHQGCYGYENWGDIYQAVNSYRSAGIPLDGIHIDVDIQHRYQTFTVDQSPHKFPNAQAAFRDLRERGIKCSTNITPIISNLDANYKTYAEGLENGYFLLDTRCDPADPAGKLYQNFSDGRENLYQFSDPEGNFNSGKPYIGEVYYGGDRGTTGHYPDLGRSKVRKWWGEQYRCLFELGLEMVWQDMTTPSIRDTRGDMRGFPFRLFVTNDVLCHGVPVNTPAIRCWNLYSYDLHKATYHGLNDLPCRKNKRNFIVGRGSFTGMHRFAALWTGDNASSWDFLRINVSQVLSLGMSGIAICGEDIGGFEAEFGWQKWADPELLMRWTIAGAFLPWFRNHYIRKGAKLFQEPYAYQYVDLNTIPAEARPFYAMVLPVCRHFIERRYRLLQLFYDAMFENCLNGLPICRSMILTDPDDKALYNDKAIFLDNQFMVRKDLLIAPILDPQSQGNLHGCRDIYLPAGSCWYAYMDNTLPLADLVEGGTTVRAFDAGLRVEDEAHIRFLLPTYVRAGAILPTIELEQFVGERNRNRLPNPITLNVYPGDDGEYTMYLDDGVSRSSAKSRGKRRLDHEPHHGVDSEANSEYREVKLTHRYTRGKSRRILIERIHDGYTPPLEKYFFVAVLHDPTETAPTAVKLGGEDLAIIAGGTPESRALRLADSGSSAWYFNERIHISFVKVLDDSAKIVVDVLAT